MRQVREVLRLKTAGVGLNEIARRVGVAPSTVRLTLKRLARAGLSWPLPAEMTDSALETALFAAADLLQGQLAAFVVQLLEAIEAVPAVAHHLAGLADIAELLGELQQSDLRPNNLLLLCHFVISVPPKGGSRSQLRVRNRAPPSGSFRKPTTTVRFSSSYYTG